jgi:hypothetical protein
MVESKEEMKKWNKEEDKASKSRQTEKGQGTLIAN